MARTQQKGTRRPPHGREYVAPSDADLWERQTGETEAEYQGFLSYRDSARPRSIQRTSEDIATSYTSVLRWSRSHRWLERTGAWDRLAEREVNERARERAVQRTEEQARSVERTQRVLDGVTVRLLDRIERLNEEEPTWVDRLSVEDVVKMTGAVGRALPKLIETERLLLGLSTANVAGHDGGPLRAQALEDARGMNRTEAETYLLGFDDGQASVEEGDS